MKKVSIEEYNKIMDSIIKMNLGVADKLIMLLEKASKYEIIVKKNKKKKNS